MLDTLIWKEAGPDERRRALARPVETGTADAAAREIVDAVRDRGDEAVRAYAAQLDGYAPESFRVPAAAIRTARARMDAADVEAVKAAADAVRRFHIRQGHADYSVETWPGRDRLAPGRDRSMWRRSMFPRAVHRWSRR